MISHGARQPHHSQYYLNLILVTAGTKKTKRKDTTTVQYNNSANDTTIYTIVRFVTMDDGTTDTTVTAPLQPVEVWPLGYFVCNRSLTQAHVRDLLIAIGALVPGRESDGQLVGDKLKVVEADKKNATKWLSERIKNEVAMLARSEGLTLHNNPVLNFKDMIDAFGQGDDYLAMQQIILKILPRLQSRAGSHWSNFASGLEALFLKENRIAFEKGGKGVSCIMSTITILKNNCCDVMRDATWKRDPGWKVKFRQDNNRERLQTGYIEWKKGNAPTDTVSSTEVLAPPAASENRVNIDPVQFAAFQKWKISQASKDNDSLSSGSKPPNALKVVRPPGKGKQVLYVL
jgi:hypothetical protein